MSLSNHSPVTVAAEGMPMTVAVTDSNADPAAIEIDEDGLVLHEVTNQPDNDNDGQAINGSDDNDAHSIITISDSDDDINYNNINDGDDDYDHENIDDDDDGDDDRIVNAAATNPTFAAHVAALMGTINTSTRAPHFVVYAAPWVSGRVFGVVPTQPLDLDNGVISGDWYAIFKGIWVGVVALQPLAHFATTGVSNALYRRYDSQDEAVSDFNAALEYGLVEVV